MKIKRILKQAVFDQFSTFYSPSSTSICAPCIIFTFYLLGIFIVNQNFKLLNRHSILLLSFVLLPFAFCIFLMLLLFALLRSYNYYYLLITIIIYSPKTNLVYSYNLFALIFIVLLQHSLF